MWYVVFCLFVCFFQTGQQFVFSADISAKSLCTTFAWFCYKHKITFNLCYGNSRIVTWTMYGLLVTQFMGSNCLPWAHTGGLKGLPMGMDTWTFKQSVLNKLISRLTQMLCIKPLEMLLSFQGQHVFSLVLRLKLIFSSMKVTRGQHCTGHWWNKSNAR